MTYTIVRDNHHFYTEDDCHEGVLRGNVFTGEVGKYRWQATVTLGVPYCSSCDKIIPTNGYCPRCDVFHADVQLTSVVGDPLFPLGNETLPNAVNWQDFARSGKAA